MILLIIETHYCIARGVLGQLSIKKMMTEQLSEDMILVSGICGIIHKEGVR